MGGAIVDVTCDESTGTLVAVGPDLDASGHRIVDVSGHALLPGLIEAHAHLDKAFLADRVDNPQVWKRSARASRTRTSCREPPGQPSPSRATA